MKYRCAIYNYDYTFTGQESCMGQSKAAGGKGATYLESYHVPAAFVAILTVTAATPRAAAARAYVRRVGRKRASLLKFALQAPPTLIERETNPRAVARDLEQTDNWIGPCWRLDNKVEAWFIRVEPLSPLPPSTTHPFSSHDRLVSSPSTSQSLLDRLRFPSPN